VGGESRVERTAFIHEFHRHSGNIAVVAASLFLETGRNNKGLFRRLWIVEILSHTFGCQKLL